MDKNYTVYHLHTEDSLLDSCTNYKLYVDKAVELGQTAIGFSEHGNCYNWIEKKMYANSKGLKYMHGCEVYLTATLDEKIRDNYHTILYARNYEGFKELNLLIDKSTQEDHFYYKPRITFDEFFNISNNVIKISACLASPLSKYPTNVEPTEESKMIYDKLLKTYDYYEIQPHNHPDQKSYNHALFVASKKYNKPLIVGTDTHSLNKYKAECRSILQKAKKIAYADEDSFDLTYKSYNELVEMFEKQMSLPMDIVLEAIENTNVMANSITDFELDTDFKYPVLYDNEESVFKRRINDMYHDKIKRGIIQPDPRYKQMVKEEMRVFKKIGMVGFMLFMSELVCWCWEHDIPIGFCRGSVGGSMIAYLTDIIDVNPLVWNTIFSRFANEDRKEIGDIDLDIAPSQRHLVYEHIINKFGSDKTAYVLAIGTISDKGTIDEIGRALSDKWNEEHKGKTGNPYSLDKIKQIKQEYENDSDGTKAKYPDIFYYFDGLVNTAISQSMHPAGIIVSPVTLPDNYGTFWNDGKRILNINMEEIHEVSLVKYDLLGLKNIEIIHDTCKLAGIPYPKSYTVNWNDENVWEHITDSPVGIFQFESKFAYDSLKKMGCKRVNDLSLVNASIRPSGESYRDRLLNREINKNPSEIIDGLLAPNNGFLVFQEDTIKFLTQICGLSGSEADNIRRAIGRKQKDRLEAALPAILEGYCSKSDKPREEAEKEAKIFLQIIEDSSNYQFGYNHSTGYSMIGYMCGYLRYYYPKEFITAYLNNANNDEDILMGTQLAESLNITIYPAKFRHSLAKYSCDKKGIYKGLGSIKFLNNTIADELYEFRNNQYNSFAELLIDIKETSVNSRMLDILIKIGFFEEFGDINYLLQIVELFNTVIKKKQFTLKDCEKLNINPEIIKRNCGKATEKTFKELDHLAIISELEKDVKFEQTTLLEKLTYENECLGYPISINPNVGKRYCYIKDLDIGKSIINIDLYEIFSGKTRKVKMWTRQADLTTLAKNGCIYITKLSKKNKKQPSDEVNPKTGKKIWVDIPNEYEYWLDKYIVKDVLEEV